MPGVQRRRAARPVADPLDTEAAREAALKLLERVRRTRSDLARRLADRGFAPPAITGALDRLAAVHLVDDADYARAYLASRMQRRTAGSRRLEMELRGRGVSADDIAAGRLRLADETGTADDGGGDLEAARRVLDQTARRYERLEPRQRRQRLIALLMRRGFDFGTIQAAMAAAAEPVHDD